jgi:hypothetical protein
MEIRVKSHNLQTAHKGRSCGPSGLPRVDPCRRARILAAMGLSPGLVGGGTSNASILRYTPGWLRATFSIALLPS